MRTTTFAVTFLALLSPILATPVAGESDLFKVVPASVQPDLGKLFEAVPAKTQATGTLVARAPKPTITLPAETAFYGCTAQNCGGSCQFFDLGTTAPNTCTKFLFAQMYSAMVYSKRALSVNAKVSVAGDTSCSSTLTLPNVNICYNFNTNTGAPAYATSFIQTSGITI